MEFSHELARQLLESEASNPFVVDFDNAWRWIGWPKKQHGKEVLLNNFVEEVDFLRLGVKTSTGGRPSQSIWLTVDCFKSLGMMAGTQKGKEIRRYFLECERIAKKAVEIIPAQSERIRELELDNENLERKQRYLELSHAIATSTSNAYLAFLRGDAPPPLPKVEYRDRYVDPHTKKEVGSATGRSLKQLVKDAGLNPESVGDRNKVKRILKYRGFDYDKMQGWSTASYLREHPVLEESAYNQVLNAVIGELSTTGEPNLFIYHMSQQMDKQP